MQDSVVDLELGMRSPLFQLGGWSATAFEKRLRKIVRRGDEYYWTHSPRNADGDFLFGVARTRAATPVPAIGIS